jgi:hypothetical protein
MLDVALASLSVMATVGAVLSYTKSCDACVAALPALSETSALTVRVPSVSAWMSASGASTLQAPEATLAS